LVVLVVAVVTVLVQVVLEPQVRVLLEVALAE
jgi:hypothetical protein